MNAVPRRFEPSDLEAACDSQCVRQYEDLAKAALAEFSVRVLRANGEANADRTGQVLDEQVVRRWQSSYEEHL